MPLKVASVVHQNDQTNTLKLNASCKSLQSLCVLQCCLMIMFVFMKESKDVMGMSLKIVSEKNGEMRRKTAALSIVLLFFFVRIWH